MKPRYFIAPLLAIGLSLAGSSNIYAAEILVMQKDKKFSQPTLKIKVGDTVNFRNDDAYFHNIFSLSDSKTFDLGSYPQGQFKKVTSDKAGTVEVECAIHPEMKMVIEVTP